MFARISVGRYIRAQLYRLIIYSYMERMAAVKQNDKNQVCQYASVSAAMSMSVSTKMSGNEWVSVSMRPCFHSCFFSFFGGKEPSFLRYWLCYFHLWDYSPSRSFVQIVFLFSCLGMVVFLISHFIYSISFVLVFSIICCFCSRLQTCYDACMIKFGQCCRCRNRICTRQMPLVSEMKKIVRI